MSNLNMATVSTLMTAKERAKMVVTLKLKGVNEITRRDLDKFIDGKLDEYPKLSVQSEVNAVVAGCPQSQASEYNFYIELNKLVWNDVCDRVCNYLNRLTILEGNASPVMYLIGISPLISYLVTEIERLPVLVTKHEYDEAVIKAREFEKASVLPLEGRFNLAEQEAYYRLVKEGKIEHGDDCYLDGYLDFMERYGKTTDELFAIRLSEVKDSVEEYNKEKERLGGDEPPFGFASKYAGLEEAELEAKVKESYKDDVIPPSEEEYQLWQKTVSEERERLLEAVEYGKLVAKDDGIEAGSYYDWNDRHQKYKGEVGSNERSWHPLHEECMEMGYSGGKVMSAIEASGGGWQQIALTTPFNESIGWSANPESVKWGLDRIKRLIASLAVFEADIVNKETNEAIMKVTRSEWDESLKSFVEQATGLIQKIFNNLALIEEIENRYFDGMDIVNKHEDSVDFSVGKARKSIRDYIERHNRSILNAIKLFNRVGLGFRDHKLEGLDDYLLKTEFTPDQEWIERQVQKLENDARSR